MIILGIDPGTATTGYGIITVPDGGRCEALGYGVIRTDAKSPMGERLHTIHEDISELLRTYRPDSVAVEQLFFFQNITSGMAVAQARGVVLLAIAQAGLPANEYTPMQVKQSLTGYGKAQKPDVQRQVADQLSLAAVPKPDDAADALAVALTHCLFAAGGSARAVR